MQNYGKRQLYIKRILIIFVFIIFSLIFILPLVSIFLNAFSKGIELYILAVTDKDALSAMALTLLTALVTVPINMLFGISAAWAITKFHFRGKNILISLIDIPFAVSPVIAGLLFVLLFGVSGYLGPWFLSHNINIIFAIPGIILATMFVTLPFVARELIPLMQSHSISEEEAAISLGASGWQTFWRITMPNIKWGLLYGVILCNARAMGEFGAVSVVSGHIRGQTNTLPLHVEILYNEYQFAASYAVASVLVMLAVVTLIIKGFIEWKYEQEYQGYEE